MSDDEGPGLSISDQAKLARAPKRRPWRDLADVLGKAWNLPNTAIGLGVGGLGYLAGQVNRLRGADQPVPRVQLGHNAVEFINNPASPLGGLTLGNATIYGGDPYDAGSDWSRPVDGVWMPEHEEQHTYQGQQLGPLYLPSNIAGGLYGLLRNGRWHGDANWNETGPAMQPPRPWRFRS